MKHFKKIHIKAVIQDVFKPISNNEDQKLIQFSHKDIKLCNSITIQTMKNLTHTKRKKFPFSLQHCRNVCVVKLSLSFTVGKIDRYQKIIFDSAYLRDMK